MAKRWLLGMAMAAALSVTGCGALGPSSPDVTVIVGDSNSTDNDTDNDTTTTTDTTEPATPAAQ